MSEWHLVEAKWWCNCTDIECCRTEVYVSDIRVLKAELDAVKGRTDADSEAA